MDIVKSSMPETFKQKPKTLKDFRSSLKSCKLFQDADERLPEFLKENLVDEARSIKIFRNDQLAYIKIFYFQFLKLCFETEDIDYDSKTNAFIELLEAKVSLLRLSTKFSQQEVPTSNIKDILFEFLEVLSECKEPVESSLARYPAIGDIITNFFCDIAMEEASVTEEELNSKKTMEFLANLFDVDIVEYESCIQFTDAQVYAYKQSETKVYMVYIDEKKIVRDEPGEEQSLYVKSSENSIKGEFEVIAFDGTDVVFHQTSNSEFNDTKQKLSNELETAATFRKTPVASYNPLSSPNPLFTGSSQKENNRNSKYLNFSKEFTNTFILDNIVSEPFRSKIKDIKIRARDERKSRQMFWL